MYEWYEIGKLNWEESRKYVDTKCLENGYVYPALTCEKPEPPEGMNVEGYYIYEIDRYCFKDYEVASNFFQYLQKLAEDKLIFENNSNGAKPMRPDAYNLRLEKVFVKPAVKEADKNSPEYIKYEEELSIYKEYEDLFDTRVENYNFFAKKLLDQYDDYRRIYRKFEMVNNSFERTLEVVGDVDKTVELILNQFRSEIDHEQLDEYITVIKSSK